MNFTNKNNLLVIDRLQLSCYFNINGGYIEKKDLISLRGTLVPATINKTISSIPVLGSILVGEKVGEGFWS